MDREGDNVVRFCAVGDVALCDGVERQMRTHGSAFPMEPIGDILRDNDLSFANLENVFTEQREGLKAQAHLLRSDAANVEALQGVGFDVVSLANNHIMDFGAEGFRSTVDLLGRHSIRYCGVGETLAGARRPAFAEVNGIRFGFLAYAMRGVQSAEPDRPGASWIQHEMIAEDVDKLASRVDHVVVALHAGLEFIDYPHPSHRELCRKLAHARVSLIVGHHPHVVHGVEQVDGCLIAYSLGNLVFDTTLMDYQTERSKEGLILRCAFDKDSLLDYELIPTIIDEHLQTFAAQGARKREILDRVERVSETMSTERYPGVYFSQATELWPKINIAVNLKVIREQGLRAFLKRLPRLKLIYVRLLFRYLCRRALARFRFSPRAGKVSGSG